MINVIIVFMKSILGKYFYPCLAGIIIEVILVFVVLVKVYRISISLAGSIYDFFVSNVVLQAVFDFISDWAIVISIIPIIAILVLFIIDIRNRRRRNALSRIHNWAQNGVLILSDYRQRDSNLRESPSVRYEAIKSMLGVLKQHSNVALTGAKIVGGELEINTKETIQKFNIIDEKIDKYDESAYDDLKILQHDLATVMMSTFGLHQKLK